MGNCEGREASVVLLLIMLSFSITSCHPNQMRSLSPTTQVKVEDKVSILPRLTQVASEQQMRLSAQWTNNSTFQLLISGSWNDCNQVWQGYLIERTTTALTVSPTVTQTINNCQRAEITQLASAIQAVENIVEEQLAPDQRNLLILTRTKTPVFASLWLGNKVDTAEPKEYTQGFLVTADTEEVRPLFYTSMAWSYHWLPDSHHNSKIWENL